MNPTLVITISVAMIGAALAIFFLLTGKNLDDGESFSLKFAATVSNPDTGTTFPSEVYFCTGDNCRYYEAIYSDWQATYDLPDFFALVGIDAGAGKVVLSELTLGWMFTFQDGTLTSCDGLGNPGVDDYDPIEEAKTMAANAKFASFNEGTVISMGNSTITIGTHDIGYNPDVNSATVLSLTMPTPEECGALSPLPTPDADQGTQVQAADSSTWTALAQPVDTSRRKLEEGRQLWGAATASTSSELWWAANGAYGGGSSTGTFTPWCSCVNGNARAQFFYKCDNRGCNMNLGFAGSDDTKDWLQNFQFLPGGPGGKYHSGFYNYYTQLEPCITNYRNMLSDWGIQIDYIVGHSLGGAVATIYAQEKENGLKGVVTWGAPKSNNIWASSAITGWRFVHYDDPVPSNFCFLGCPLISHQHVLSNAFQYYDELSCWNEQAARREQQQRNKCSRSWWKFWCWFEWVWVTVYEWVRSCAWQKKGPQGQSQNFAHNYHSLVWAGYGAFAKHSAYGDYPALAL
jgi:pimeloyl-ACP methyl ester carboxylesterase